MTPEEKISALGITLPDLPKPLGSYLPYVRTGSLVFLSGQLPLSGGALYRTGRLGESVGVEDGSHCARIAAINAAAILKSALGDLGKVRRCVKVTGYVASSSDFTEQPKVVNGASDFMREIFGEKGTHARAAVGVNVLPMNAPVEIDFIFEVED